MPITKSATWALLATAFASPSALAGSFAERCPDIPACAKVVSELLGQKYLYDADVRGRIEATSNLELTRENAELLFTSMLNINGFSRVPAGQESTWQIARQRDARDLAIPTISASETEAPALPNTWDLVTMKYRATHADAVENIARTSRSFMPANSRIIPELVSGTLLVTDTALNLKKLYGIIKDLDRRPSAELKRRWAESEKAGRAEAARRREAERASLAEPGKEGAQGKAPSPGGAAARPGGSN